MQSCLWLRFLLLNIRLLLVRYSDADNCLVFKCHLNSIQNYMVFKLPSEKQTMSGNVHYSSHDLNSRQCCCFSKPIWKMDHATIGEMFTTWIPVKPVIQIPTVIQLWPKTETSDYKTDLVVKIILFILPLTFMYSILLFHLCYSTIMCKALLNTPHSKIWHMTQ